jgi:hypothetical protein
MILPCNHLQPWIGVALLARAFPVLGQTNQRPNIVIVLADDLGMERLSSGAVICCLSHEAPVTGSLRQAKAWFITEYRGRRRGF